MRTCKLWYHKREDRLSNVDFLFCPKEFPDMAVGDLVELFQADNVSRAAGGAAGGHRLLVQVTKIVDEFGPKQSNTVSVDQSLATAFQLKNYGDVVVTKLLGKEGVTLNVLELSIKEQSVGRADQYRFRRFLLHSCVHMHRKIEFCGIRVQVQEMRRGGERVSCGYVDDETRVVFRSSSAATHILIQMSAEMWEFDGDGGNLYMEKCLDGFLPDLFRKWHDKNCSHYVTVVVFSRWFYPCSSVAVVNGRKQSLDVQPLNQFPPAVRDHVVVDHRGTPYQDFYHVMIQNEHYDEWMPMLSKIKRVFYKYRASMGAYQRSLNLPKAENSTASNGNFLEALNLPLNFYESNLLHCGFEHTDQLLIVVSPGSGVFNVDHNLMNLTQQRTVDLSASIDLVCLGEQPLHIVPLFICNSDVTPTTLLDVGHQMFASPSSVSSSSSVMSKKSLAHGSGVEERYCSPYWINISYYSQVRHCGTFRNFTPRIQIPESLQNAKTEPVFKPPDFVVNFSSMSRYTDLDIYDAALLGFNYQRALRLSRSSLTVEASGGSAGKRQLGHNIIGSVSGTRVLDADSSARAKQFELPPQRKISSPINVPNSWITDESSKKSGHVSSFSCDLHSDARPPTPQFRIGSVENDKLAVGSVRGSRRGAGVSECAVGCNGPGCSGDTLNRLTILNPFKPCEYSAVNVASVHRWIHVFPTDDDGRPFQAHYFNPRSSSSGTTPPHHPTSNTGMLQVPRNLFDKSPSLSIEELPRNPRNAWIWAVGPTGENQWNSDVEIGMDWKSLTLPACLPVTTDFFPDARTLTDKYFFSEHSVLLDEGVKECWSATTAAGGSGSGDLRLDVFNEFICQRLQRGFQEILQPIDDLHATIASVWGSLIKPENECFLSVGRIYHRLAILGPSIYVTKFLPRQPLPAVSITYRYQLQNPDSEYYAPCVIQFNWNSMSRLNWSVLDNLVLARGEGEDYRLKKEVECRECRFVLVSTDQREATRKIMDGQAVYCDIYMDGAETPAPQQPEAMAQGDSGQSQGQTPLSRNCEGFLKFMETVNRLRRNVGSQDAEVTKTGDSLKTSFSPSSDITSESVSVILALIDHQVTYSPLQSKTATRAIVSAVLVGWLVTNVADIKDIATAIAFGQSLVDDGKLCHVSGDPKVPFKYGFFLYNLVGGSGQKDRDTAGCPLLCDMYPPLEASVIDQPSCSFERTDRERKGMNLVVPLISSASSSSDRCPLLLDTFRIDFDPARRSDRCEWGQIQISRAFVGMHAFEINLQWVVGTGSIVSDLVYSWWRKAIPLGLNLIPVPLDPFLAPYCPNSDPFRAPMFVPIAQEVLEDVPSSLRYDIQCRILYRFGFVPIGCMVHGTNCQFVHVSGGMIAKVCPLVDSAEQQQSPGYLWSWNWMLSHRYRTQMISGDARFQDKLLMDLRDFCANKNNRLRTFLGTVVS